jgi:hypothetical protein
MVQRVRRIGNQVVPENTPVETVATEEPVRAPIRWKKVGGGSFLLNNRYIKPNQVFTAYPEEIPKQFRDVVIPLDKEVAEDSLAKAKPSTNYTLQETPDGWNIIDSQGKQLNENSMSEEAANRILKTL